MSHKNWASELHYRHLLIRLLRQVRTRTSLHLIRYIAFRYHTLIILIQNKYSKTQKSQHHNEAYCLDYYSIRRRYRVCRLCLQRLQVMEHYGLSTEYCPVQHTRCPVPLLYWFQSTDPLDHHFGNRESPRLVALLYRLFSITVLFELCQTTMTWLIHFPEHTSNDTPALTTALISLLGTIKKLNSRIFPGGIIKSLV